MNDDYTPQMELYQPPPSKENRNGLKAGMWIYSDSYIRGGDKFPRKWLISYVNSSIIGIRLGEYNCTVTLSHSEYRYHNFKIISPTQKRGRK